ncbi:MAG TPA: carbohydrate kinase family protein [Candidatus Binatia bacterium]|nr:carbohydrate kinase family protein [Candidatus Binatia bacterium]
MAPLVAVIGDALLDVHVTPAAPIAPGADVPAAVRLHPGGQGANLATRLARRGVAVRLTCALGDDAAGAILRAALAADRVDVHPIASPATGAVVVLVAADGGRTMLSQRVPFVDRLDIGAAAAGVEWLVLSGYLLLEPNAPDMAEHVEDSVRLVVVGCAIAPDGVARWIGALRALRPSLVVLNREEATLVSAAVGDAGQVAVALAHALGASVVVTEPDGASAAVGDRVTRVSAPGGARATDTTGAGDAFAATLLVGLLADPWPPTVEAIERAMDAASRAASEVARSDGAQARVAGESFAGAES